MKEPLLIRGHHLDALHVVALLGIDSPGLQFYIFSYTPKIHQYKLATLRQVVENPDMSVKIIGSLDYLCEHDCPNLKPSCSDELNVAIDKYAAEKKYDFEVGKVYDAGFLVDSLRAMDYKSLQGDIPATLVDSQNEPSYVAPIVPRFFPRLRSLLNRIW